MTVTSVSTTTAQPVKTVAVSSDPELIALLQTEQRYVETVRVEQEAAGLRPPMSGMPGLSEWRAEVLKACTCGGPVFSAECPVHAPLAKSLA